MAEMRLVAANLAHPRGKLVGSGLLRVPDAPERSANKHIDLCAQIFVLFVSFVVFKSAPESACVYVSRRGCGRLLARPAEP